MLAAMATLISLSGLPGVGKTTIARALSQRIGALHLRVDSVEAALKTSTLRIQAPEDAGYLAIAAVAGDNLSLGLDVIADTVNPVHASRRLWADTAVAATAGIANIEVVCSDRAEHRRRVEARVSDIRGHAVPDWESVETRHYEPWTGDRLVLDSAQVSTPECVARIVELLAQIR